MIDPSSTIIFVVVNYVIVVFFIFFFFFFFSLSIFQGKRGKEGSVNFRTIENFREIEKGIRFDLYEMAYEKR